MHKRDPFREVPAISGGMRKAALEWKYGLRKVGDDPEPLINYLDVSIHGINACVALSICNTLLWLTLVSVLTFLCVCNLF